jgi:hypothetical protein
VASGGLGGFTSLATPEREEDVEEEEEGESEGEEESGGEESAKADSDSGSL